MATILIVDDEEVVRGAIRRVLSGEGHQLTEATNGQEALDILPDVRPDLIVLDILMPELSGLDLCRRIRSDPYSSRIPIIFLTAKGRPDDIVQGLDAGGDDYLVKPFDVIELPARIRAALRRAPNGPMEMHSTHITVGDLRLPITRPEVEVNGQLVELTSIEHRLLYYLMLHAGQPMSVDRLLQDIWEYPKGVGNPKLVQVHIANLRSKVEPDPDSARYVLNIRGRGYLVGTSIE